MLTVVVYNFSWSIYATADELVQYEKNSRMQLGSVIGSVIYLFGFTSSVYHLCFMMGLRLYAILFPLRYRMMDKKTITSCLVLVWILASAAASAPGKYLTVINICSKYSSKEAKQL